MTHPRYNDWPDDIKDYYDKIRNNIKKHGHVIQGTVDGKDALERPFAYTIGASFKTGAEFLCFFPIKGKGLSIITGIINRILDAVKEGNFTLSSQIINDNHIYNLPIAMLVLEEEIKQDVESVWPRQLERDGFLAEFSTNDHKLILLICTDKNGNFPWDEKCESYWPQLCPPPFVAMAQEQLTGDDSLLCRLEENSFKEINVKMLDDGYTGKGTYTDLDSACKYVGEFKNGTFNGQGIFTLPDGSKYVGEFKDDKQNGQGTLTFIDGENYVGEWKDGVRCGQGTWTWPDGSKYIGEFKDGLFHGQGTFTSADGEVIKGLFENGKYIGEDSREDIVEKESSNKITEDTPIWEIIQHEFINLGKGASVLKKEFSNLILSKYPHIKKGTLSAQIAIQVINKRSRTNYNQCGKERVCGDNKFDFLFEQEDKTLCKYDQSKHGTWEIYKRDDGKLDVRIFSK